MAGATTFAVKAKWRNAKRWAPTGGMKVTRNLLLGHASGGAVLVNQLMYPRHGCKEPFSKLDTEAHDWGN